MKKSTSRTLTIASIVFLFLGLAFGPMTAGEANNTQASLFVKNPSRMNIDVYKLLIIAPSIFKNALQPLVVHKKAMGLSTKLVTLNEVYHQMYWHGRDNAVC